MRQIFHGMAEILALFSSGVAILQVAETATKLSRSLFRLARRIRSASKEIEDFAMRTQEFAGVIGAAHMSLQNHNRAQGSQSPVLRYLDSFGVYRDLVTTSERVTEHTKALMPQLRDLPSRLDLLTRFKWVMQREAVKAMGPRMESVKTSLMVVMTVIILEKGNQQERSAQGAVQIELRQENKYLKDLVKGLMRILTLQQEREREYWRQEHRFSSSKSLVLPELGIEDALVELGDSMVRNGTVPTTIPDPRRTSVRSTGRRRTHRENRPPAQPRETSHRHRRRRSHPHASAGADVPPGVPPPPSPAPREVEVDPRPTAHTSRSPSPVAPGPSRALEHAPLNSNTNTDTNRNHSTYSLHLPPTTHPTTEHIQVQARVRTLDGVISIPALLIPDLERCLIHQELAARMRYDTSDLDAGGWITYGDGQREKSMRGIKVVCTIGELDLGLDLDGEMDLNAERGFELKFIVFQRERGEGEVRIFLGREYLEKERQALKDS